MKENWKQKIVVILKASTMDGSTFKKNINAIIKTIKNVTSHRHTSPCWISILAISTLLKSIAHTKRFKAEFDFSASPNSTH